MPVNVERHARHILLKEIGGAGQQRLNRAHITLIGVGGLGSPAALYLAAAGVGTLRLVDPDTVSLDNLQRQILFRNSDIARSKVEQARDALSDLDPDVRIECVLDSASPETLERLLTGTDLVLDGCDCFATRFAVNDAAIRARVPLISGAVGRWSGQVGVFAPHAGDEAACYRCLVPDSPPDSAPCSEVGIVGALTGLVGSTMALEAVKWITGAGEPLLSRLMIFEGLTGQARTVRLSRDLACPSCHHVQSSDR